MKKIIIFLSSVGLALAFFIALSVANNSNATAAEIDKNMDSIRQFIKKAMEEKMPIAFSSNPYDYVADNENYNNIVKIGSKALPILVKKIEDSPNNGLEEYILAIATEEIAKVDLKGDNWGWSNAKAFAKKWKSHLKDIPNNVQQIVSSNDSIENKNKKLIKLGTPAIPFIMDHVEQGHVEIAPSLDELLKGNADVTFNRSEIKDIRQWVKDNKEKFSDLRDMVNKEINN